MPENTQNNVIQLHNSEKKAWERMPGEKPLWFMRFKRYCLMGRERSLQRVWEQERQAPGSTSKRVPHGSQAQKITLTPGNWKQKSIEWSWVERSQAWDLEQRREWEDKLLKEVFVFCDFTSRAYRIECLDSYATLLRGIVIECISDTNVTMQDRLAAIKLTQSLMSDIRRETDALVMMEVP